MSEGTSREGTQQDLVTPIERNWLVTCHEPFLLATSNRETHEGVPARQSQHLRSFREESGGVVIKPDFEASGKVFALP